MKFLFTKAALLFLLITQIGISSLAQEEKTIDKKQKTNDGHCISLSILRPVADFSSTHFGGIAVGYEPANHWFGLLKAKHIAFTYQGGLAYYFGKKETVSGYPYKYPGYFFLHAFAGVLYNPVRKIDLSLTAGPALSIYNGKSRFNIGSKLEGTYSFNNSFAASPGIIVMKENKANPIWAVSLKISYSF